MNSKVAIVLTAFLTVAAAATPITDCGSLSTLKSASIGDCEAVPCTFQRGTDVTVDIEWVSDIQVANFHAGILFPFNGSYIHVPGLCDTQLREHEHCSGCPDLTQGDCPIEISEVATYTKTITIDASWPVYEVAEEAIFKIDLEPTNDALVCFTVPIIVN